MDACVFGRVDDVKMLLLGGAEVDEEFETSIGRNTPLRIASYSGHVAIVELLLDHGADKSRRSDETGFTPLIYASLWNHLAVAKLLLDRGAEIDEPDVWGRTPLMCASVNGHLALVEFLLDRGADPEVRDEDGSTALIHMAQREMYPLESEKRPAVAKLMLNRGAEINAVDKDGCTALIHASTIGHLELVEVLLDRGADIGEKSDYGETALLGAVRGSHVTGHAAVVKILIERGVLVDDMLGCANKEILDLLHNHVRIRARYLLKRWRIRLIARNFWLYWYFRAVDRVYAPGMPGHEETMAALEEMQQ